MAFITIRWREVFQINIKLFHFDTYDFCGPIGNQGMTSLVFWVSWRSAHAQNIRVLLSSRDATRCRLTTCYQPHKTSKKLWKYPPFKPSFMEDSGKYPSRRRFPAIRERSFLENSEVNERRRIVSTLASMWRDQAKTRPFSQFNNTLCWFWN